VAVSDSSSLGSMYSPIASARTHTAFLGNKR
jgi:hypothetical protein